jgi:hypothetical protein
MSIGNLQTEETGCKNLKEEARDHFPKTSSLVVKNK